MSDWRELFGFMADERPSYELVHDRYAERIKALTNDQRALSELGGALGQARKELVPLHLADDRIHPEQLLPP